MGLFSRKKKEAPAPKGRGSDRSVGEEKPKPEEAAREEVTTAPAAKLPKGEDAESYRMILKPHITEKGTVLEEQGKYLFKVARSANKAEVKGAIEKLYKVKVEKVHVLKMPSKFRQVGKYEGRKPGFKKAIVTLKEGERIEMAK